MPLKGGVISFERMNKIIDIDEFEFTVTCEPGVITADIHSECEKIGLFYPPDPSSAESCTIGGNISTNAGGPRTFKYGVTSDYLLELECIFSDGKIERVGKGLRKYVSGYDILKLLCGSEGTLALFTKIKLKIIPKPEKVVLIVIGFEKIEKLFKFLKKIFKKRVFPSAIEFIEEKTVSLIAEKIPENLCSKHLLFIELDGSEQKVLKEAELVHDVLEEENIKETLAAEDSKNIKNLWKIRKELFYETEKKGFKVYSEDLGLSLQKVPSFIEKVKKIYREKNKTPYIFGHLGDGNIHINTVYKKEEFATIKKLSILLWSIAIEMGGTITAEHGVGFIKKKGFIKEHSDLLYQTQKKIKKIFDPHNILNPGKIF